jgi:hypothetical protein
MASAWAMLETNFAETTIPEDEKPQGVEAMVEADLLHSRSRLPARFLTS